MTIQNSVLDEIYKQDKKPLHILIGKFQPVVYLQLDVIRNILNTTEGRLLIFICSPKNSFNEEHILSYEEICDMLEKYWGFVDLNSKKGFRDRLCYRRMRHNTDPQVWSNLVNVEINKIKNHNEIPVLWGTTNTQTYYKHLFPDLKHIVEVSKLRPENNPSIIRSIFTNTKSVEELNEKLTKEYTYLVPKLLIDELVNIYKNIQTPRAP